MIGQNIQFYKLSNSPQMWIFISIMYDNSRENGVLPRKTYRYSFDHRCQAALGPDSTWRGDHPNDKYAGYC
jgi:hypothetical protein